MNMKQMTDQSFDKIENPIARLHAPIGNIRRKLLGQRSPWGRECNRGKRKNLQHPLEKKKA